MSRSVHKELGSLNSGHAHVQEVIEVFHTFWTAFTLCSCIHVHFMSFHELCAEGASEGQPDSDRIWLLDCVASRNQTRQTVVRQLLFINKWQVLFSYGKPLASTSALFG